MSEASAGAPESREQIAGLTFALLLLKPDLTIETVPGSTHFLPMERADLVRDALMDAAV